MRNKFMVITLVAIAVISAGCSSKTNPKMAESSQTDFIQIAEAPEVPVETEETIVDETKVDEPVVEEVKEPEVKKTEASVVTEAPKPQPKPVEPKPVVTETKTPVVTQAPKVEPKPIETPKVEEPQFEERTTIINVINHEEIGHSGYQCRDCGEVFSYREDYDAHVKSTAENGIKHTGWSGCWIVDEEAFCETVYQVERVNLSTGESEVIETYSTKLNMDGSETRID